MKTRLYGVIASYLLATAASFAQGTFVYDQQSATNNANGSSGTLLQQGQPEGQSFTPSLSSIGFVQMQFFDPPTATNVPITLSVSLWGGSLGGTFLGSTQPVLLPGSTGSFDFHLATFLFSAPISLTPGNVYFLQPIVEAGGDNNWGTVTADHDYPGGTFYLFGAPQVFDGWFREGIVVPEPSALSLLLIVASAFLCKRRK